MDNVFTSPDPAMKKSFDISKYFGEQIDKIKTQTSDIKRGLNLSNRLSEETPKSPKSNDSPIDFKGIKRIFA